MEKNISAVIFDFDGVIVDSIDSSVLAFHDYFLRGWITQEFKTKKEFLGFFNKDKAFTEALNKIVTSKENKKKLQDHYGNQNSYYIQSSLMEDSRMILDYLMNHSCSLGIVSSNLRSNIESILNKENIKQYFRFVISGDTNLQEKIVSEKPSPEGILYGLNIISVKPENAIFVGDTGTDILAGKNANIGLVVAKASDESDYNYLSNFNPPPDKVIRNLSELLPLIY